VVFMNDSDEITCCGVAEFAELCGTSESDLETQTKNAAPFYGCIFGTTILYDRDGGSGGYARIDTMLEKQGWKAVATFRNPNTDNILRMWVKILHPAEG